MRQDVANRRRLIMERTMDLWMYLVVIGMFLIAIVGTVWITLWTIQRGERARAERSGGPTRPAPPPGTDKPEQPGE
jgi:hypothetical protein